jgi:predicted esterase
MGGRTALRCGGDDLVGGVCALAPWIEPGEPVAHLAGRKILIAHGDRDRVTDPQESREFAERAAGAGADVRFQTMAGDGHAMLRHARGWNALVTDFVAIPVAEGVADQGADNS